MKIYSERLSKELNAEVKIGRVEINIFNRIKLEDVLVRDKQKDTLLYAGQIHAKTNNWFFLKDEIIVHDLSLKNTNIYIGRSDSIWNYQFIIDHFSQPSAKKNKEKKKIKLDLKSINISNFHLVQNDSWLGSDMTASIEKLVIDAEYLLPLDSKLKIKKVTAVAPSFSVYNYTGKKGPRKKMTDEEFYRSQKKNKNLYADWKINIEKTEIVNGEFRNQLDVNRVPHDYFDEANIHFYDINGIINNLSLNGDTLYAKTALSGKERSGFEINNLETDFLWYEGSMTFQNLNLETPNSKIGSYFSMGYKHFIYDMNRFVNHINLEADFINSNIHTKDLSYFAPILKEQDILFGLKGKTSGTIEHLKISDFLITAGNQTSLAGNLIIDSIFDIDSMRIQLRSDDFKTGYTDIVRFFPQIENQTELNFKAIKTFNWTGNFSGKLSDFSADGNINTSIGEISTAFKMKIPSQQKGSYEGNISTSNLNIGLLFNNNLLGKTTMTSRIKGSGFNLSELDTKIESNFTFLELNNYAYNNILLDGILKKESFKGSLNINDQHIILKADGTIGKENENLYVQANGNFDKINLKKLNIFKKEIILNGNYEVDISKNKDEDLMGFINLSDILLIDSVKTYSFNNFSISQNKADANSKALVIQTDELNGKITGNYNLYNLPALTLKLLHNYFPAYISAPQNQYAEQNFKFEVETNNVSPYFELFEIPLRGFNQSSLNGKIDVIENKFETDIHIPFFAYKNFEFNEINITGKSNLNKLMLNSSIKNVLLSDNISMPNTEIELAAANDTGFVFIKTRASQTLNDASLNAKFKALSTGFVFNFLPSTLVLNEKTWQIEDAGDLLIGTKNIYSDGIRLVSGYEEIFAYTHPSETGSYNDLSVEIKKLEAGDLLPLLFTNPRIEGRFSGKIDMINPFGKYLVEADLFAENFRLNNDSIGNFPIKVNYTSSSGDINYTLESANFGYVFNVRGRTNISDQENIFTDNEVEIKQVPLSLLEPYLTGILSDIRGSGTGVLKVKGKASAPDLIGEIRLNKSSFMVDYTRCKYLIKDESSIIMDEDKIIFNDISLKDTTGKEAIFTGDLRHQFFNDMFFNLSFRTEDEKKGLLVLNTRKKDNSLFYGTVTARASGSLTGPAGNMLIKLNGEPTDSSKIYLPTSDTRVTGTASFIVFKNYGTDQKKRDPIKAGNAFTVDLDLNVNPFAKAYIILDEITNDVIEGQGRGAINLRVGTNEKTTMTGNFEITAGRYNFNWQSLFKRPFIINKGTINWNGDPYDARINIDANYKVENVSLPPEFTSDCSKERNSIIVVANLSNTLKSPQINFRFLLPNDHPCRNSPITNNGLNQLYNNPDELNRQVISLLLMGSFISGSSSGALGNTGIGSTFFSNAAGTLSEFIAQQVSSKLDAAIRNIPAIKNLNLDPYVTFTPGLISGSQAQGLGFQGTGNFGFTSRLLNGRLMLKAGGSVLVAAGQNSTVQNNNQLTPDLSIEWLVTPDGKLRLIGFYRTVFDIQRRNDRTGISFSYVKEFNELW